MFWGGHLAAFRGLVADPRWGVSMNVHVATLLRGKRLPCYQFLCLWDIFPSCSPSTGLSSAVLAVCGIPLWSPPCLPSWKKPEISSSTNSDRLWCMEAAWDEPPGRWLRAAFPRVYPVHSYSIQCFLFCTQQFLTLSCEPVSVCGLLWRGLQKLIRGSKLLLEGLNPQNCAYASNGKWLDACKY